MDHSRYPGLRGWTPGQGGSPPPSMPQGPYPGIGDPFSAPSIYTPPVQVLPPATVQTAPTAAPTASAATPAKGGGLGSMLNFNEIKGMVERMGGIDGILSNVGKLQKIMATMQQMAPILRLLVGKGAATAAADASVGVRPRKRRRTGNGGSSRKRRRRPSARTSSHRRRY